MASAETQQKLISVAVVDDDARVRNGLQALLDAAPGFCCAGLFVDVPQALAGLPAAMPEIVLLDVGLPGISGLDAISPIREALPEARIIMHSNYDDEDKITSARRAGARGYLLKNQDARSLQQAIARVHAGAAVWPAGYAVDTQQSGGPRRSILKRFLAAGSRILKRNGN